MVPEHAIGAQVSFRALDPDPDFGKGVVKVLPRFDSFIDNTQAV
ncbi:MAG: hypothetical protein ACYDC3_12020 [Candidatus Binataceae bacterium]